MASLNSRHPYQCGEIISIVNACCCSQAAAIVAPISGDVQGTPNCRLTLPLSGACGHQITVTHLFRTHQCTTNSHCQGVAMARARSLNSVDASDLSSRQLLPVKDFGGIALSNRRAQQQRWLCRNTRTQGADGFRTGIRVTAGCQADVDTCVSALSAIAGRRSTAGLASRASYHGPSLQGSPTPRPRKNRVVGGALQIHVSP
jgi:hypothetical protein